MPTCLAHMPVLLADRAEPVLPAHRIDVLRLDAVGREPVRPLPAELRAEHGAMRLQPLVERRDDARPAGLVFLVREADRVVLAIGLERAVAHPVAVAMQIGEAADVDDPKVERRLAVDHPLRQHPAGAAAGRDAEGVEAGADEHVRAFGRDAEDEIAVRREALRPVDHLLDAGGLRAPARARSPGSYAARNDRSRRRTGGTRQSSGTSPVVQALRVRLVAAHHQAADLFLEIGAPVGIADGRRVGRQARRSSR